jgi:hypothetical protein
VIADSAGRPLRANEDAFDDGGCCRSGRRHGRGPCSIPTVATPMRWTACASLIVPFRILELLAPCARKRVGDGAWSPLPSVGGMPAVAGLARGESCGLDVDTCAMLIVCRSSWTATSSSASQPRKPHSRTSRTSVRNGTPEEVDDAWVSAPNTEKAARFASAEAMRWLEWGLGATTTSRWASLCS